MRLLFITIAGNSVGFGHLSRCLALAEHARSKGLEVSFLLFGDEEASLRVEQSGHACTMMSISVLGAGFDASLLPVSLATDAVVVDFSHAMVLANVESVQLLLEHIRNRVRSVMLFDGLREQALAARLPGMPIDILALPYVAPPVSNDGGWRILQGPEFAPLSAAYAGLPRRAAREVADRVLVSCGGSDPTGLTPLVLEGLKDVSWSLDVRVVIGPLFNRDLIAKLTHIANECRHKIALVNAPDGLTSHMLWCDLAITTSGLTKYELAATATPAVLISIDAVHDLINRPFAELGTTVDLGVNPTAGAVTECVTALLNNSKARTAMMEAGRRLVDGRGTERLINEIIRSCCVDE
jgi:UDP-2,4-diacetamido-2,4,6-trideoxy-beta-L-altropyranose hydrolase